MAHLDQHHLALLNPSVPVPTYDRTRVQPGIVHFGVGGFHRAHQAMYLDALMNLGHALEWGIVGVGVMPQDSTMKRVMDDQDCLYTLVEKHPDGSVQTRVIGSIVDFLFAPDDPEAVLRRLTDPRTRIVSLTVTEGGYHVDQDTGAFDDGDAMIQHDLQPGAAPITTFGFIAEALSRRRAAGIEPFTVMSCDNIQGNGQVARSMIAAFATLKDPVLGTWIRERVSFPNSMVDRITPVTADEDRQRLADEYDVQDAWPVACEPYAQWVLEDDFPTGRPPLDLVGVQFVEDVMPYELMKLRLLNASHQALCYLGYLAGHRYVHEVCQDPLFVQFLNGYMDHEATPSLAPVPGIDLSVYKRQLIERFANAEIRDTLARLCAESSDRIPKWLVPVVRHRLENGGEIRRAALVIASWARYAEGLDEDGVVIEVVDRRRDEVVARARRQDEDPTAFLDDRTLFGSLGQEPRFVGPYLAALESLHTRGARATVARWETVE